MSFSASLSNALSGLKVASRMADVVSSNVANAMTEGYAKRSVEVTSGSGAQMGGVTISSQQRMVDIGLLSDRRAADASFEFAEQGAKFARAVESAIGLPDEMGSFNAILAKFERGLLEAAGNPGNINRLNTAVDSASAVANKFNDTSATIQDLRVTADAGIRADVDFLNASLGQIVDLNAKIQNATISNRDASSLKDQRQLLVDGVAKIIPLKEVAKPNDAIALISQGGLQLVDGRAVVFGFQASPVITPNMTVDSGQLSGVTVSGRLVGPEDQRISGGRLAANFEVRDTLGIAAQEKLDAVAVDLLNRFAGPTLDPTQNLGDAGLFTDRGAAYDPLNTVGLAGRIAINSSVDPNQGGEAWRLRDGVNAVTSGPEGDATILDNLLNAIADPDANPAASTGPFGRSQSLVSLSGTLLSSISTERLRADENVQFEGTKLDSLNALQRAQGVDTDDEMQKLLLIEKAYSANAKVIQTLDAMLDELLRIGR